MTEKLILIVSLLFFNYNNEINEACTKEYTQKLYVQKHMLTLFHIENFCKKFLIHCGPLGSKNEKTNIYLASHQ